MLTIAQAAERLNVSPSTVKRLCDSGAIKCINVGTSRQRLYRIFPDTLFEIRKEEKRIEERPVVGVSKLEEFMRGRLLSGRQETC